METATKALQQLISIFEAKKDVARWANISALEILEACINETKDVLADATTIPSGMLTKIRLSNGKYFDFANPNPDDIDVEDIARGIAREFRFANQTDYTVAQHVYYASLEPGTILEKFERLHHDDSEGIMKDMPKPLKNLLPDYQFIESKVTETINKKLGLPFPATESCHVIDKRMFDWEYRGLMLKEYHVHCWTPEFAEKKYLERHYELLRILELEAEQENVPNYIN